MSWKKPKIKNIIWSRIRMRVWVNPEGQGSYSLRFFGFKKHASLKKLLILNFKFILETHYGPQHYEH